MRLPVPYLLILAICLAISKWTRSQLEPITQKQIGLQEYSDDWWVLESEGFGFVTLGVLNLFFVIAVVLAFIIHLAIRLSKGRN